MDGGGEYWRKWKSYRECRLEKEWGILRQPGGNQIYEPQYAFDTAINHLRYVLTCYSCGDPIGGLSKSFCGLLDAWELSNQLAEKVCREHGLETCRDWDFNLSNLNHYNWCFWLVGLALSLEVPDTQWQRLLALIDSEGEDVLLDRIIASRQPARHVGTKLLHSKPYMRLFKAIDAPREEQASLLRDFVDHWYAELKRPAPRNRKAPTVEPYWYDYGDPEKHPLEKGSYFGRWCIEAVAAVKAFGIDDKLCLGHEYYPGDLLRPAGPSTHTVRIETKKNLWARLFGK
ncbi:PoNe immunity protein domain-containing protein [Pseudomonas citronellolis]|uniref:PoNe immunity protein domain-containing protein n=1 Tax=Pseudomonas citronellolis TaxID=53408 RepID=UPI0023E418F1|nr:PoNe immunity protein domain-containing protein [Pseudomonas citronellolis]MDF3934998.1 DUF1911 domain-containing protein [Pseudomonas citronellolis]